MARLSIEFGDGRKAAQDLDVKRFRIGRSAACELVIDEPSVSRVHAIITEQEDGHAIEDLGSSNGTFVNDSRVEQTPLRNGDRIRIGAAAELQYLMESGHRARRSSVRKAKPLHKIVWELMPIRGPAIPLTRKATTVGRNAPAQLVIDDESVSRIHARLDDAGDHLVLTDLKSRNGSHVNGEKVVRAQLMPGDEVKFGSIPFEIRTHERLARRKIAAVFGSVAAVAVVSIVLSGLVREVSDLLALREARGRIRAEALASVRKGIDAFHRGEADFARSYLLYAVDVLTLSEQVSSTDRPVDVLREAAKALHGEDRDFDFAAALDAGAVRAARARLDGLSNREYVEHEVRRIAVELGQDEDVPQGFVDQVWRWVDSFTTHRGQMRRWLARAPQYHPRLRSIMNDARLPEVFCYVAWVESGLDPTAVSHAKARGLWQFMAPTAREYGLRVSRSEGIDERTDVEKSTRAATQYIGNLIKMFGREQFMCALASYNRGEGGVWHAMRKIPDPMMPSSKKYWYLVENRLLPAETSDYVPKIFATRIVAEDPGRFGFDTPDS